MFVVFVGVVLRNAAMGSVLLPTPSGADLDSSVRRIRTVADDKVIAQLVHSVASVCLIESPGSASLCGAVVNDDVLPAIGQVQYRPGSP